MDVSTWVSKLDKGFNDILKYAAFKKITFPSAISRGIIDNLEELYSVTSLLGDEKSKELFLKIIIFRFGVGLVKGEKLRKYFGIIPLELKKEYENKASFVEPLGIIGAFRAEIMEAWVMNGLIYENECELLPGDIVVDAGAFTGATPLYFHEKVGKEGKVYAFEPSPKAYETLEKNISSWGISNIVGANYGLSDFEGTAEFSSDNNLCSALLDVVSGPSPSSFSSSSKFNDSVTIQVTSIDKYFLERNERVDFIKMDIEGAELSALLGAKEVIRKYTPKMAISIYHRPSDLFKIPLQILELNPNYQFFLKHNTVELADTILFCKPTNQANKIKPLSVDDAKMISSFRKSFESVANMTCTGMAKFLYQKLLKRLKV